MVERIDRPGLPKVPRLVPLPSAISEPGLGTLERLPDQEAAVDEFGLATEIYGDFPREQRRLVSLMLTEVGGSKRARPPLAATIAEAIFFGLLLDNGFSHRPGVVEGTAHFIFQSFELGGRQPGGAVVDFMVYHNWVRKAVRVQSKFHDLRDPFGGGGQVQAVEVRLKEQLMASFFIDDVIDVNEPPERVLETSGDPTRVRGELDRVLYGKS